MATILLGVTAVVLLAFSPMILVYLIVLPELRRIERKAALDGNALQEIERGIYEPHDFIR